MASLAKPAPEELGFRERLLSDEATMSYNRYVLDDSGEPVGEAAYHLDETRSIYLAADNPSLAMLVKCGFEAVGRSEDAILVRKIL